MKRQDLFKYGAGCLVLLCATMYSFFWYHAGLYGFDYSWSILWAILITFIIAVSAVIASKSQYLETKHSIIFTSISISPVIVAVILFLQEGEIIESIAGFGYASFVLLLSATLVYGISIFVKE